MLPLTRVNSLAIAFIASIFDSLGVSGAICAVKKVAKPWTGQHILGQSQLVEAVAVKANNISAPLVSLLTNSPDFVATTRLLSLNVSLQQLLV